MTSSVKPLIAAAVIAWTVGASAGPARSDDVKISVIVANTGTYAFVGTPLINSIKLAEKEMTASNAFGAHKVTIEYQDNRSDKQEALALITRAASQDTKLIIGPISSAEGMAAGPVANNLKIALFTTATTPEVLKTGPWVFKSTETADAYMTPVADYIGKVAKPKACFLVSILDNEGYIRQRDVFRDALKAFGVQIAGDESILASDTDFTSLSTKIVASKADCLFVTVPSEQAANVIIQAKQAGLPNSTIIAGDSGAGAQKYIDAGGAAVEGVLFPASFVADRSDETKKFSAAYKAAYGVDPDLWAATGYSMMAVVASALRNIKGDVTRDNLRAALADTKDVPVVLGQGKMTFDADRVPHVGGIVMQVSQGKWVIPK